MAHHKSAKKRARQAVKRRARNRQVRSGVRSAIKAVRSAVESGGAAQGIPALRSAERVIRKAASKGVVSKKRASRQVSRLAKSVQRANG